MKRSQSSITAEGIAFARAMESYKPEGERVCFDPYARQFISLPMYVLMRLFWGYAQRRSPGVSDYLAVRTRHIDECLQSRIDSGIAQLVILGAGFDSRAYRFPQLKGRVKIFEVDHPATQAVKLARLKKIFGAIPDHVTFVPIDFNTDTLADRLAASRYDRNAKTLFIWEGVTYYLTAQAVDSELEFVAQNSGADSSIIFDYIYTEALDGTMKRNEVASMRRSQRFTGEGFLFGIRKGTVEEFLARRGFDRIHDADTDWLKRTYFTGVNQNRPVAPAYAIVHAMKVVNS
jgi:methyltransferase (TIGR00027 family)